MHKDCEAMRVNKESMNPFVDDLPNRFFLLICLLSTKCTSLRIEKTCEYQAADNFEKGLLREEKRTFGSKSSKLCCCEVLDKKNCAREFVHVQTDLCPPPFFYFCVPSL